MVGSGTGAGAMASFWYLVIIAEDIEKETLATLVVSAA